MSALSARRLLGRPVRIGALRIGSVGDVLLGADLGVVLGVIVETKGAKHCFLPWVTARLDEDDSVAVAAATTLLGQTELDYYVRSGVRLTRVLGLVLDGQGVISDVSVGEGGRVGGFVAAGVAGARSIPLGETRVSWKDGRVLDISVTEPSPPVRRRRTPALVAVPEAARA